MGKPTIYYCEINTDNIILHKNFPWEFQIKKGVKVHIVKEVSSLLKKSKLMGKLFDEVNF